MGLGQVKVKHMIIHKEAIEDVNATVTHNGKYQKTLDRIAEIEATEKDIKIIPKPKKDEEFPGPLNLAFEGCEDYDLVILYGCCRHCCLDNVAHVLTERKIPVAYNIIGTTD